MASVTFNHITCDKCGTPYGVDMAGFRTLKEQRRVARKNGWTRSNVEGVNLDLCTTCKSPKPRGRKKKTKYKNEST